MAGKGTGKGSEVDSETEKRLPNPLPVSAPQNQDRKTSPCRTTPTAAPAAAGNGAASSRRGAPGRSCSASRVGRRIARGGACVKFATKRRSRRTGDPETAPFSDAVASVCAPPEPTLRQFTPLKRGQGGNSRRSRANRVAICVAPKASSRRLPARLPSSMVSLAKRAF